MASSRPPSGMVFFPNGGESEKSGSSANRQMMKEKMLRQRQLSLERQRNVAKSTFGGVKAQELPIQQGNGYDRISNAPRINLKGPNFAIPTVQQVEIPADINSAAPVEKAEQSLGDISQLPRCQTANSNLSSVELLSNDGDGRPGFERCGGRATAAQQGIAINSETWMAREPTKENVGGKEESSNVKKWWKPKMFGGNRAQSEGPSSGLPRVSSETYVDQVASCDRANVRTPDSVDRTFFGPAQSKRTPLSHNSPRIGRPPVPQPQCSNAIVQPMPGAIIDLDSRVSSKEQKNDLSEAAAASPVPPRPTSGGSAAARASSVPAKHIERQNSPARLPSPGRGLSAFGSSSLPSAPSSQFGRGPVPEVTEIIALGSEDHNQSQGYGGNSGWTTSGGDTQPKAPAQETSPSPVLGAAALATERKGGRRGWRPWGGNKEPSSNSEPPKKPEPVKEVINDVMPFSLDD